MHRGLHQRRVEDGLRHPLGLGVVARLRHRNGEQLGRALAIARELAGQVQAHLRDRLLEGVCGHRPGRPGGKYDGGVRGRGVGIDAQRVERAVDDPPEHGVELAFRHLGIGADCGDHRRHVGLDHPDALGYADDTGIGARDVGLGGLGVRVGRHHRLGDGDGVRRGNRAGPAVIRHSLERGAQELHGIAPTDHPGRGDEHLPRVEPGDAGGELLQLAGIVEADLPRGDVRVLRDRHQRPARAAGKRLAAHPNRGPCEEALGEHGRGRGVLGVVRDDQRHVRSVLAQPRRRHEAAKTTGKIQVCVGLSGRGAGLGHGSIVNDRGGEGG